MMATDYNAIFFPFRLQSGSSFGTRKRYSGDDGLGAVRGRGGGGGRKKDVSCSDVRGKSECKKCTGFFFRLYHIIIQNIEYCRVVFCSDREENSAITKKRSIRM